MENHAENSQQKKYNERVQRAKQHNLSTNMWLDQTKSQPVLKWDKPGVFSEIEPKKPVQSSQNSTYNNEKKMRNVSNVDIKIDMDKVGPECIYPESNVRSASNVVEKIIANVGSRLGVNVKFKKNL